MGQDKQTKTDLLDRITALEDEIATLSRIVDQDLDDLRELAECTRGMADPCLTCESVVAGAILRHEKLRMDKMAARAGVIKPKEAR